MKIKDPHRRLKMFWGKVDQKHICQIEKYVIGKDILDMGAGYGTTSTFLQNKGYNVIAIDLDSESIEIAKKLNPLINYKKLNAEDLPFEDASFDTLVLRDALHHFVGEANFEKVKKEMYRVLRNDGRIIFKKRKRKETTPPISTFITQGKTKRTTSYRIKRIVITRCQHVPQT